MTFLSAPDDNNANGQVSRKFIEKIYRKTGVTPALRHLYERYRTNEGKRKTDGRNQMQES